MVENKIILIIVKEESTGIIVFGLPPELKFCVFGIFIIHPFACYHFQMATIIHGV